MPRKGFRSLTLSEVLYERLLERIELYGTTPQGIIIILMSDGKKIPLRSPHTAEVPGSSPGGPTCFLGIDCQD